MNAPIKGHIVKRFDGEIDHLHQMVMQMGDLVIDQMHRALRALDDEDSAAAQAVVDRDKLINDLDIRIDDELIKVLARRQPVAGDLRVLITVAKTVTDLERIGDQTRRIARLVEALYDNGTRAPGQKLLKDIHLLADFGIAMLNSAMQAFEELDVKKAVEVIREDAKLEAEFQSALRRLATFIMEDSRTVGQAVEVVLGLRALERIGGHAKNIAGYVIYLATGRDVRHVDLSTLVEQVLDKEG